MSDVDRMRAHFQLFQTAIGPCGIAWRGDRVVATHLPEVNEVATRASLTRRAGGATEGEPPPAVQHAIAAIIDLLDGNPADLAFVDCDMDAVEPFHQRVYAVARTIKPGETRTYGDIAIELGDKSLAQPIGHALGRNPFPIIVPCHRVVGAGGKLTGFSASGGIETKLRMLAIEGATLGTTPDLFGDLPFAVKPSARGGRGA